MQHRAARTHRNDGQGVGHIFCRKGRAFEWVKRDIYRGAFARAHFFTDVEHRSFVTFAFTDNDNAFDVQFVQLITHRVYGGLVRSFFVTTPDQFCRCESRSFGDAGEPERKHTVVEFSGLRHVKSPQVTFGCIYAGQAYGGKAVGANSQSLKSLWFKISFF